MADIDEARIAAIRARLEAATPVLPMHGTHPPTNHYGLCCACGAWTPANHPEAHEHLDGCAAWAESQRLRSAAGELAKHAPADLRDLLAEVEAGRAREAALRRERDHLAEHKAHILATLASLGAPVSDGGQYRADIDSAIGRLVREAEERGAARERERIVADLRGTADRREKHVEDYVGWGHSRAHAERLARAGELRNAADRYERGEHLSSGAGP
ncbi:MAG TPA: hypothetical protein VEA41_16585 [Salinarimonas sp.]|nr:hypothetical protein [Salinarimonas sp.]